MKVKSIKISLKEELKNIINKEKQYTIPIFIPHKGCKNECVFCNQRKISGEVKVPSYSDVNSIIDERLKDLLKNDKNRKIQVAFFGGSFTGLKICEQEMYLKVANKFIESGLVSSIRLSTRPDYISVKILKMLKKYNVKSIELGVQSMDDNVLKKSKRGHTSLDVIRASRLIKMFGFSLGHQIMIGLPSSTIKTECETIKKSLALGIEDLRIYPVYVINPTELYEMYKNKEYKPLTLKDATNRTYLVLKECLKSNVRIIRIGLQSTDEITVHNDGIVGPVCDNFAEYAISRLILDKLEAEIDKVIDSIDADKILLIVDNKYLSMTIGPKKINKIYLNKKYNKKIEIIGES